MRPRTPPAWHREWLQLLRRLCPAVPRHWTVIVRCLGPSPRTNKHLQVATTPNTSLNTDVLVHAG
jgi:hypothetical protein